MKRAAVAYPVPLPLRLFHLVALLGFTASAIAAAGSELFALYGAFEWPYNSGTRPYWLPIAGAALATITLIAVLAGLWLKRALPLYVSLLVPVGFAMALTGLSFEYQERNVHGANKKFIDVGSALFDVVRQLSRDHGTAPDDPQAWNKALQQIAETQQSASPYRKGLNGVLPFRVELTAKEDTWPREAPPGTVLVWVSDDRSLFSLRFIGLDDFHQAALLKDDAGKTIALKGGAKDDIF